MLNLLNKLSMLVLAAALFGAGCYWMGRSDEADSDSSVAFKRGFEAGKNDCGGITCDELTIAIGQAKKESRHTYDAKAMDALLAREGF